MRLLVAELGRFLSRRAVVVLLLVGAGLALVLGVAAAYDTRPLSGTEVQAAQEALREDTTAFQEDLDRCREESAGPRECARLAPELEQYLTRSDLDLGAEVDDRGTVLLVLLGGLGLLIGATYGGAGWSDGSIGTQLLFEPRRARVWVAKGVAAASGTTVAAALVTALFWVGLAGVALVRDLGVGSDAWGDIAAASGRGLILVAGTTLGAYALAMLLHSTVASLAVVFGYTLLAEAAAATLPVTRMTRWTVPHNVLAWVKDGVELRDPSICSGERIGCVPWYSLGSGQAAAYLGLFLALAVLASLLLFVRRDVD